jgi:peroxiredoxin
MDSSSRPGSGRTAAAKLALLLVGVACVALAACARSDARDEAASWAGHWRAALQLPGGELPFGLEITADAGRLTATVVNGVERLAVDEAALVDGQLLLRLPGYDTELLARRVDGRLEGTVTMVKKKAVRQQIPFVAQPGSNYGFFAGNEEKAIASLAGRWAVTFTEDDAATSIGVGEFTQDGAQVSGTVLTPTADLRYLSGELRGDRLYLRSFNGGHAYLFHLRVTGDGLEGEQWSGLKGHTRLAARRDEAASLGDAEQAAKMRPGAERLTFSLPDLQGHTVSLADERFRGKVVVVTLGGSWCPNCHDEAALFAPWYRELRGQGLEIVGLMFEQYADFGEAARAVGRFRERYAIEYPLLIAGENDRDQAARLLPQLTEILAYPTTIFIDRGGKVRRVHTGFSGPATGAHYETLKQDFDRTVRALLAEKG